MSGPIRFCFSDAADEAQRFWALACQITSVSPNG
jgi:hypothetical protein